MRFNGLSDAESERLIVLAEEAAEVIKVIMKVQRHGWHPTYKGITYDNRKDLETECGDFLSAMHRCIGAKDLGLEAIERAVDAKTASAKEYLHHQ